MKKIFLIFTIINIFSFIAVADELQVFPVKLIQENMGCGCSFSYPFNSRDEFKPIFMSALDFSGGFILINNKIVNLDRIENTLSDSKNRTGDDFYVKFKSENYVLTFYNTITFTCDDVESESCEVMKFDSLLNFYDGKEKKEIKLVGDCGC